MNVSYFKELTHAFVARPSELRELVTLLEENIGPVEIRADCKDDISRKFDSIEELISYRNPKSKELRRVYFNARSDDNTRTARIRFLDSIWVGILIDLTGPENVVSKIKEEARDIFSGMCPKYSIISISKIPWIYGVVIGAISMLWLLSLYDIKENEISFTTYIREIIPAQLILGMLLLLMCFLLFRRPYNYLFPHAVFVIGQGKLRFENQQRVRWCVIIGFFVSLAAGLIIAILQLFVP